MARKDRSMAVAEREPQTETENKAKRKRVDVETLPPDTKVAFMISIPAGMKVELEKRAETRTLSASALARDVIAQHIGYDIPPAFLEGTRQHKYSSKEEQLAAQKEKAKATRDLMKKLLAKVASGEIDVSSL